MVRVDETHEAESPSGACGRPVGVAHCGRPAGEARRGRPGGGRERLALGLAALFG